MNQNSDLNSNKKGLININVGTNSIVILLIVFGLLLLAYRSDVLNLDYLKSLNQSLSFFIGLFSIILGSVFFKFWSFDRKSKFLLHLTEPKNIPKGSTTLYTKNNLSFAISYLSKVNAQELPLVLRQLGCISIFFLLALITLDNRGFSKVTDLPGEILQTSSDFCPEQLAVVEEQVPKAGCALILKAFELGYAKDLGECEPEKVEVEKLKVCEKRRKEEPYAHYFTRQITSFIDKSVVFFTGNEVKNIKKKFEAQLDQIEALTDYQRYAISAAPRASHHIWTNLPFPKPEYLHKAIETLLPGQCLEDFQNQTNTINATDDEKRKYSQYLEHAYGQLLFNPKVNITAGFCKEYTIHWNAEIDTCEQLANNPTSFLTKEKVLPEVELVFKRHDLAKTILSLDESLRKLDDVEPIDSSKETASESKSDDNTKNTVFNKNKIAKSEQQLRDKNELVSFQCFMRRDDGKSKTSQTTIELADTQFKVNTRFFPITDDGRDPQILMYKQFSSSMENKFRYTQYNSQSNIKLKDADSESTAITENEFLQQPSYRLTRLEVLKDADIFLGNEWILKRDDLLEVYPYHVHLKNYVEKFRVEYIKNHGRL
ncbi:hypothetical protein [Pleionea sediminis]|uniref:hypothetical protein n=1 Tax=Pleionea sediminis TaxID=2569479 RepID=UPI001184F832|nr:hypothetical protein [Pleionea sediminis]